MVLYCSLPHLEGGSNGILAHDSDSGRANIQTLNLNICDLKS